MKHRQLALLMTAVLVTGTVLGGCGDSNTRSTENSADGPDRDVVSDSQNTSLSSVSYTPGESGSDEPGWTLLVYLCGSDLESDGGMATLNLEEMCSASLPDNVNVIVETGGTSSWQNDVVDADVLGRYRITDGDLEEVGSVDSASMGDPATLSDFIQWGVSEYPSAHYGLVLWDHGGGNADGVCYDELYDSDNLTMPELQEAVSGSPCTFDMIGFDACLMASMETAKALNGAGYYLVASEETEPGEGWDYTTVLDALGENPSMKGDTLGKVICDSFMDKCDSQGVADEATLSVVDLTAISSLDSEFDSYTSGMALAAENVQTLNGVASGADRAESYGGNTPSEGYCNMVDVVDLVQNTQDYVESDGTGLLQAIDRAVVYETHGSGRENSNGISVFYPISVSSEEVEAYAGISDDAPYLQYIAAVTDNYDSMDWSEIWSSYDSDQEDTGTVSGSSVESTSGVSEAIQSQLADLAPVTGSDFDVQFEQSLDDDGYLNLSITSDLDAVKSVHFLLWYETDGSEDADATEYVYLGEDNDIEADWDKGTFKDNFFGSWMTIGGEYISAELIEETDNYNLYSIPAEVNGEETNLRAIYDFNKEEYRVLGIYDGMDTGSDTNAFMTSRGIRPLEEGDEVAFLLPTYEADTDENIWYTTDTVTWSDDVVMEDEDLGDGFFLYMYEITDIFGNTYDSDPVEMQAEGDSIIPYQAS
ncbi:MAG: clostripain-related cysteine peptidase [Eubacterium sp.]|nr:clostripain-related cysteine peptidase [Eubacterium sp.]